MSRNTLAPSTITVVQLTGQTDFTIPFEYLARKFVVITLLGRDRKVLTLNTDYRFVSKTVISLSNPRPEGYTQLELRRETSATERLVDFHDGSILRAYDLNLSQVQTLHVAEEARDLTADTIGVNDKGDLDARGRKIVNLGDAINQMDAVNLKQLTVFDNSTLNNANRAEAARDAAERYRDDALSSRNASEANKNTAVEKANIATEKADIATQKAQQATDAYNKIVPLEKSTVDNAKAADEDAKAARKAADEAIGAAEAISATPVGTVAIFLKRPLPAGWLELDGSRFDLTAYPALRTIFPNGVLEDLRDRYPKMTGSEIALLEKKGWRVGTHNHNLGSSGTVNSTDLGTKTVSTFDYGTKTTNTTGNHNHGGVPSRSNPWDIGGSQWTQFNYQNLGNTNDAGNHSHTVAIGSHNHTVAIGSHGHSLGGRTEDSYAQTNEVSRIGVIFAIKAAGGATSEDFINVSKYEERLRKLENDVIGVTSKLNTIEKTSNHMRVITLPYNTGPNTQWFYMGALKGNLKSSLAHGCTIYGGDCAGKNGVTASGQTTNQHCSFVATVNGSNGNPNAYVNSCLQIFTGAGESQATNTLAAVVGIATSINSTSGDTYVYLRVADYNGNNNSSKILVVGDHAIISGLLDVPKPEANMSGRIMGRVYVFQAHRSYSSDA